MSYQMSKEDKTTLRLCKVNLISDLDLSETFWANIMLNGIITEEQRALVESLKHPTPQSQRGALVDILPRRGPTAFEEFVRALVFSGQQHVAASLSEELTAKHLVAYEEKLKSTKQKPAPSGPKFSQPLQPQGYPQPVNIVPPSPDLPPTDAPMTEVPPEILESPIMSIPMNFVDTNGAHFLKTQLNENDSYKMSKGMRGRALIINNEYFLSTKLQNREGSQFDVLNISELFRKLHFQTVIKDNVSAEGMLKLFNEERKYQNNSDAFILFIMSHGTHGRIFGIDGESISIEEQIVPLFDGKRCPDLINKPKLFFIQACQGQAKSTGISGDQTDAISSGDSMDAMSGGKAPLPLPDPEVDENLAQKMNAISLIDTEDSIPTFNRSTHERADMVLAYSTLPGYLAWRNSDLGSWFVRSIVYIFSKYSHERDVMELLRYVRRTMNELRTTDTGEPCMQITTTSDQLMKRLFFCPGYVVSDT